MSLTLAVVATAVLSLSTNTDTTVAVKPGTRLELENFGGAIVVKTWTRDAVRIEAEHSSRTVVEIDHGSSTLLIEPQNRRGVPSEVEFQLTVPAWMPLELSGVYTDIEVSGTKSDIQAETVQGDVTVTGGSGNIHLQSVEGRVKLAGASGHIEVSAVNEDIEVSNVQGDLTVEGVNGGIAITGSTAASIDASTVNGYIRLEGELRKGGRYQLSTHNGNISVAIPEKADVEVSVSTYSGDFDSTFPVNFTSSRRGRTFRFRLGAGSAQLEIESFQGQIELHRPGERSRVIAEEEDSRGKSGKAKHQHEQEEE